MNINYVTPTTYTSYVQENQKASRAMMTLEEFKRRCVPCVISSDNDYYPTVEGNISPKGLWPEENFESEEELYKRLAEKYDMTKLQQGDLTTILATLHDAGVLSGTEYGYALSPVPVFSLDEIGAPAGTPLTSWEEPRYNPVSGYNALTDYRQRYTDYIYKYCMDAPPSVIKTVQNAIAVHNKVDDILHEIQKYRV